MNRQLIVYESLAKTCNEFDKLRVNVLVCQRGLRGNVLQACQLLIFTCQCVEKCANGPYGALMFQLGAQLCWKPCHFSNFSLTKCEGKFVYFIILYKKFYILLDSIIIHIICIYIVHKNCMILHFYTSFYIKQKFVEFFFSIIFFVFAI